LAPRVRRAVGAEEELRAALVAAHQRLAVGFALEHRQAVVVRAHAAGEQRVAVVEQVVRGDGGGRVSVASATYCAASRVVMCSNTTFSSREVAAQRLQVPLDEHRLAVEQVDLGSVTSPCTSSSRPGALHGLERAVGLAQVGHAGVAVGGGAGRVELHRHHAGGVLRARDLVGRRVVGEVQRHQRLEAPCRGQAARMRSR
jgi:hypothetical protein